MSRKEAEMKRVLLIGLLTIVMGLAGCFYRSHDHDGYQNDRGRMSRTGAVTIKTVVTKTTVITVERFTNEK